MGNVSQFAVSSSTGVIVYIQSFSFCLRAKQTATAAVAVIEGSNEKLSMPIKEPTVYDAHSYKVTQLVTGRVLGAST